MEQTIIEQRIAAFEAENNTLTKDQLLSKINKIVKKVNRESRPVFQTTRKLFKATCICKKSGASLERFFSLTIGVDGSVMLAVPEIGKVSPSKLARMFDGWCVVEVERDR